MNIIPEKKYGKIGCINNMDILIKINLNLNIEKKKNINIIFDNSISTNGECFLKLKNGIRKLISLIPSDYNISIYTNEKIIYTGNNKIIDIFKSLRKVQCQGFNNYEKYINLNLDNCLLFTDEEVENEKQDLKIITVDKCLNIDFLYSKIHEITDNIGKCEIQLYPLNNNFIKKIYNYDNIQSIIINNFIINKDYNILINMDILSVESILQDIFKVKLFHNNKLIKEERFKMLFIKENSLFNNDVLIQKILYQGNLLEKSIIDLYQQRQLLEIKSILYKLKNIYNFGNNPLLIKKYINILNCILYLEEELNSESLKSLELNYEMKFNHFDLNK